MSFINLKIKISLAQSDIELEDDEEFVTQDDIMRLSEKVSKLNAFSKDNNENLVSSRSPQKKKPFKTQLTPDSCSDFELPGMSSDDWDRLNNLKKDLMSHMSREMQSFSSDESAKSKEFVQQEVLNRFDQFSDILIFEVKQSMDAQSKLIQKKLDTVISDKISKIAIELRTKNNIKSPSPIRKKTKPRSRARKSSQMSSMRNSYQSVPTKNSQLEIIKERSRKRKRSKQRDMDEEKPNLSMSVEKMKHNFQPSVEQRQNLNQSEIVKKEVFDESPKQNIDLPVSVEVEPRKDFFNEMPKLMEF